MRPETPSFKGYLFWYFMFQCILATGVYAGFFTYGFTMTFFHLVDTDTIIRQAGAMEKPSMLISAIVSIIAAVQIASRHGIKFGKGFGGYLLGNLLSYIVMAPLLIVAAAIEGLRGFWINLALIVAYIFALAVVVIVKRRHALTQRKQAALIEPFT